MTTKSASVLALIMLLVLGVGLAIIAIHSLRELANSQTTKSRMKDLVVAMHSCDGLHRRLPPAYDAFADIEYPASLHVHLLRFMKEDLYKSFVQSGGTQADESVAGFHSPSDASLGTGTGVQNYAANLRVFSDAGFALGSPDKVQGTSPSSLYGIVPLTAVMPGHGNKLTRTFINGTSNTICFATKFAVCGGGGSQFNANPTSPFAAFFGESAAERPAHPSDPEATFHLAPGRDECRFWPLMGQSFRSVGITVAMGDGSVRNILPSVTANTWNQALQPNDGYWRECDW